MTSAHQWSAGALAVAAFSVSAMAQGWDYGKVEFTTTSIASNLYMLTGSPDVDPLHPDAAGGTVGVLTGPGGVLMVDAHYAQLTDKLVAAIKRISPSPIRFLVNTHVHRDHTSGDANFGKMGVTILAREELREGLAHPAPLANGSPAPAADPAGLPVVTYGMGGPVRLHMNGEIVTLIPVRAAHTGGDTMIRFEHADAVMVGDFFRGYGYPYVDPATGGTLKGVLEALDATIALANPRTRIIPGHGPITNLAALRAHRDMITAVQDKVRQMIAQGRTRQDVLAAKLTVPYDKVVPGGTLQVGGGTSADRFIDVVYSELKGGGR